MASERIEDAFQLLRSEYLDLPDFSLTAADVTRLLDQDRPTTGVILRALTDSRFLEHTRGRFTLAMHDGWGLAEQPAVNR